MFKIILKLALISFLQFASLYSQTPSYYHYTSSDGLASSTVYDIIQDQNGFMWFATANGLSKFDGNQFTTFRINDGLNSNSIIAMAEGKNGELYFGNYEKGINVLKDGKIQNYFSEIKGNRLTISFLMIPRDENYKQTIYAHGIYGGINAISESETIGFTKIHLDPSRGAVYKLTQLTNGKTIAATSDGLYDFENEKLIKLDIAGLPNSDFYSFCEGDEGSYLAGAKSIIYHIKNDKVIKRYDVKEYGDVGISHIFFDSNKNIWFSIMNKGFYFIPKGSDKIINIGSKMGLQNSLVNKYFEDNEGNIWISTFGKGVYCLNNLYLKSYNENDGLSNNTIYSIVKENSGKIIIGTFNGINILEDGKFRRIKKNIGKPLTEYIYGIKNFDNTIYVGVSLVNQKVTKVTSEGINFYMVDRQSFAKTKDGLYLFGTGQDYIIVNRRLNFTDEGIHLFYTFRDSSNQNRINDIFEDSQKNVWIATANGLCKLSGLSYTADKVKGEKSFFPDDPVLNSRINSVTQDNQNNVWFAGVNGIARYNLDSDSVTTYTNLLGHDLSASNFITFDKKGRLWLANMKGLFLIDGNTIKLLTGKTGLPSSEVLSLFFDESENLLYVGTSNGLSFLYVDLFDSYNYDSPELKILNIRAGDSVYTNYNNLVFKPDQHDVYVNFKALNFSSPGSVQYRYKLDTEWIITEYDALNFISLKSGNYNLQIMAKAQNTEWSKPYSITFSILPRFVETAWYDVLIILSFGFVSLLLFAWRWNINNKKRQAELELTERINELKHQALSAMMNPHFIFNSLNSVQYLINCQRNEEANDYIAMMAKLIRKNLDTAGSGFILLSDEIKRLKLYLDLEKLRFQEKFAYEIITGNDVDTNLIMIPNMIIQPFAENSLWHGIINSGSAGNLSVSFTFEDVEIDSIISRSLIIKIKDNGIGLAAARNNKKEDHISKGIKIVEERLKLLSAKMQLPQPIMFEDLSVRSDESHGTEIIISLPPPLYKNIGSTPD
ncbi:MAG: histidine kinase [Ignavibacteriaceae bacterium]|nr:histidine kinase [Ignavibacteriaceae bacterium]